MIMIAMPNRGGCHLPRKGFIFVRTTEKCASCNFIPKISGAWKLPGHAWCAAITSSTSEHGPEMNRPVPKTKCFDMSWPLECSGLSDLFWNKDLCNCASLFLAKGMCITDRFTAPNQARVLQPDPCGEPLPHLRLRESNLPRKMCASGSNLKKKLVMLL